MNVRPAGPIPGRRKDNRAVKLVRRPVGRPTYPCGAQFTCETLMLRFQRADIDPDNPNDEQSGWQCARTLKPIETEPLARLDSTPDAMRGSR